MESEWWANFENIESEFLKKGKQLTEDELTELLLKMKDFKEKIDEYQESLLRLGRIVDYDKLLKNGFSFERVVEFYNQDENVALQAKAHLKEQLINERNYMFGYPANMIDESSLVSYLRWIESQLFYMNSCGTPYSCGNYRMAKRETELEIIQKIKNNLNLNDDEYWGYITTGGTEGNLWGIREGFTKYPNGKLYFSHDTHYSAIKGISIFSNDKYQVISSSNGAINKNELLKVLLSDEDSKKNGVILLLNCGTTTFGSIDDIGWIVNKMKEYAIPYYVHVDAALYGGIPKNQINSPVSNIREIMKLNIDSISISLHKYLGIPKTNGVLLARSQMNNSFIEYIGQSDVTLCGSRDFLPFTTLQKIKEQYERNNPNSYSKNIMLFENLLFESNINYEKGIENGNIFVLDKPSNYICQKYQLATFHHNGVDKAHIIIFPFHSSEIIKELVDDIKNDIGFFRNYKRGIDKK